MTPRRALLLAIPLLVGVVGLAFAPASYDDAYISYRYADNLAHGRGFAFNPGETVLGTTAAGYCLLLAGLRWTLGFTGLGVDAWGAATFLAGLATLPWALAGALRRLAAPRPELIALVFALLALPARWNVELMGGEALPILALVAAAFVAALDGREILAGALVGAATAFRFDAGLAIAALALALACDRRRLPWRFALTAAVAPGACAAWLFVTFGSILPNTLSAKRSEMSLVTKGYGSAELEWTLRSFGNAAAISLLALALVGGLALVRANPRARIYSAAVATWVVAIEVFYRAVGVPFAPWYHLPTLNVALALAAAGAVALLPRRRRVATAASPRLRALTAASLALIFLGVAFASTTRFYVATWGRPPDPRIRIYRDIAEDLQRRSGPEARVAAVEIGALAYFANRPVVDLVGLVDPRIVAARSEGRLAETLAANPPDYLVDNPVFHASFLAPIAASEDLERRYDPVATFSRPEHPNTVRLLARRAPTPR